MQKNQKQEQWNLRIAGTEVKAAVSVTNHHDTNNQRKVTDRKGLPLLEVATNNQWAYLGPQKPSEFFTQSTESGGLHYFTQLELTIRVPKKKQNILVLQKSFYDARRGVNRNEVKSSKGHFEIVPGFNSNGSMVYSRRFPIMHRGATVHSKIKTSESENNLYVAFMKNDGSFVVVAVAVVIDPKKGAYLVFDQVYNTQAFKTDTGLICPLLEDGVNGRYKSKILWEFIRRHYQHKMENVSEEPEDYSPKPALALGRLKTNGDGDKAVHEIFVDMISPARRMSMGLDREGRHVYINWDALEVGDGESLRYVPLHSVIRARLQYQGENLRAEKIQFLTPLAIERIVKRIHRADETGEETPEIIHEAEKTFAIHQKKPSEKMDGSLGDQFGETLAGLTFFAEAEPNEFEKVVAETLRRHIPEGV